MSMNTDRNEIIADIGMTFHDVILADEVPHLVNKIKQIVGSGNSISVPSSTNTVLITATWDDNVNVDSKIAELKKLENVRWVDFRTHKLISRGIAEKIEISDELIKVKQEFERADKIDVEELSDMGYKFAANNVFVTITGDYNDVRIGTQEINVSKLKTTDRNHLKKLQKKLVDHVRKSKLSYLTRGIPAFLALLELVDWLIKHYPHH